MTSLESLCAEKNALYENNCLLNYDGPNLTPSQESLLVKFFAMSYVPNVNGVLGKSVPRNALPLCTRNTTDIHGNPLVEEVCWEKILTDKGICLSSALSTTKVFCDVVDLKFAKKVWPNKSVVAGN